MMANADAHSAEMTAAVKVMTEGIVVREQEEGGGGRKEGERLQRPPSRRRHPVRPRPVMQIFHRTHGAALIISHAKIRFDDS